MAPKRATAITTPIIIPAIAPPLMPELALFEPEAKGEEVLLPLLGSVPSIRSVGKMAVGSADVVVAAEVAVVGMVVVVVAMRGVDVVVVRRVLDLGVDFVVVVVVVLVGTVLVVVEVDIVVVVEVVTLGVVVVVVVVVSGRISTVSMRCTTPFDAIMSALITVATVPPDLTDVSVMALPVTPTTRLSPPAVGKIWPSFNAVEANFEGTT